MDYDILIVGGGMVGATLACALGDSPLRVGVIEPQAADRHWPREKYDIRVSAITRATQRVFAAVGAWPGMVERRVSPYRAMAVWDASGSGHIEFDCVDIAEPDLGLIVENSVILAALLERLEQFGNIDLLCPARVKQIERRQEAARVTLEDGKELTAQLLVGADGAQSWLRDQAGITTTGWSYDQTAVVATIKHSRHHEETAFQRFMPEGPLAFLPLPEQGLSSIVWSVSPEHATELVQMDPARFLDELQTTFGERLGRMESVGPRGAFPLILKHADSYVSDRIALVGNAAHAIHPLAGQGLNLGVSDAAALAEVLLDARERSAGQDLGSWELLRRYERWRKGDNVAVMAAMDGFKRLFSNDVTPLRLLRNAGMSLTNSARPVKNMLIRRAMGLSGDLPRLARHG